MKPIASSPDTDLEALFAQHWNQVYGLLFRLVGEHAEAEDLALEVFWRYHNHPPAERDAQRLGGWLYRVAVRLGYNALRAQRRRSRYEESAGRQALEIDYQLDPASQVEHAELRRQVRQVLAQMKPRAAKILILRYTGLSYAQIATTLELPPGSIGTWLARAEADFHKRYEQTWRRE